MFCTQCGSQNDDHAFRCLHCGAELQKAPRVAIPQGNIPNYLVQSILVTVLCCLPLGIPAIVFAAQVNGKLQSGDVQGAMDSSRKAKMWCWLSFGLGLLSSILYFLFVIMAAASGASY